MISSTRLLTDQFQGKPCYRLDTNQNHRPDADEPMVVQNNGDKWSPVGRLEPTQRFAVEEQFGFWTDRQVSHTEGWIWDREEVIDRPKNGEIEADEVDRPSFQRLGRSGNFELGAEILKDSDGALFVDRHYRQYGPHTIIGEGQIADMKLYRADDANWLVSKNTPTLIGSTQGPISLGPGSVTVTVPITGKV
jgi:hypothetical protein